MAPKWNNKKKPNYKARDRRVAGFDEIEARNRGEEPIWKQKKDEDEEEEEPEVFEKEQGNAMASAMVGIMGAGEEAQEEAPTLSRKQKEEIEKERKKRNYELAHARGETDEAKSDLERLRQIKERREEAKAAREAEAKAKKDAEEAAKAKKTADAAYVGALGGEAAGTGSRNKKSKKKVATEANQMEDFQDKVFVAKKEEEKKAAQTIEALAGSIDACRLAEDDFM